MFTAIILLLISSAVGNVVNSGHLATSIALAILAILITTLAIGLNKAPSWISNLFAK